MALALSILTWSILRTPQRQLPGTIGDPLERIVEPGTSIALRSELERSSSAREQLGETTFHRLRIRTRDEAGAPIEGVRIRVSKDSTAFDGSTDTSGLASFTLQASAELLIEADKSGYLPQRKWMVLAKDEALEIVLARAWCIRGSVVRSEGSPVPDCWVLIHPQGPAAPDLLEVATAMESGGSIDPSSFLLLRTDAVGRFESPPLDWQGALLLAGVDGSMTVVPALWHRRTSSELVLTLRRAYAAVLEILEPGRSPIFLSRSLPGGPRSEWYSEATGVSSGASGLPALLAGLDPTLARFEPGRLTCMFVSDSFEDVVGPCFYRAWYPGYSVLEAEFQARSLRFHPDAYTFVLERVASRFVDLRLRIVRSPSWTEPVDPRAVTEGLLILIRNGEEWSYPVGFGEDRSAKLDSIPLGGYAMEYRHRLGNFRYRLGELPSIMTNPEGREREVEVDLSSMGAIELRFEGGPARALPASISVRVGRDVRDLGGGRWQWADSRTLRVSGPPYVLPGYEAGSLALQVESPEHARLRGGPLRIAVEAGQLSVIELH